MMAAFVLDSMPLNAAFQSALSNDIVTSHTELWFGVRFCIMDDPICYELRQDNARQHVAKTVRDFYSAQHMQLLPWSAYSLNMSVPGYKDCSKTLEDLRNTIRMKTDNIRVIVLEKATKVCTDTLASYSRGPNNSTLWPVLNAEAPDFSSDIWRLCPLRSHYPLKPLSRHPTRRQTGPIICHLVGALLCIFRLRVIVSWWTRDQTIDNDLKVTCTVSEPPALIYKT
ncbi:uncharacterized protein TNCV_3141941 [Trichonephila clavipes]|nr:uncharacterized protein TNCV_3141941 [Trichonephila clavipes]